jgi:hypothetical protein
MARMINWNTDAFHAQCARISMNRLEAIAEIIRDDAKKILKSKLVGNWTEHGPYKTGKSVGAIWTERTKAAMVDTIRVVRKKDEASRNIRIYMGNFKTWWAVQMEFGHGSWRGGARAALRPAMRNSLNAAKSVLENGNGETG